MGSVVGTYDDEPPGERTNDAKRLNRGFPANSKKASDDQKKEFVKL